MNTALNKSVLSNDCNVIKITEYIHTGSCTSIYIDTKVKPNKCIKKDRSHTLVHWVGHILKSPTLIGTNNTFLPLPTQIHTMHNKSILFIPPLLSNLGQHTVLYSNTVDLQPSAMVSYLV